MYYVTVPLVLSSRSTSVPFQLLLQSEEQFADVAREQWLAGAILEVLGNGQNLYIAGLSHVEH